MKEIYLFVDPLVESELQNAIETVQNPNIGIAKIAFSPQRSKKSGGIASLDETKIFELFQAMRQTPKNWKIVGVNTSHGECCQGELHFLDLFLEHWIAHPETNFRYPCHFDGVLCKYSCPRLEKKVAEAISIGGKWLEGIRLHAGNRYIRDRDVVVSVLEAALDGKVETFYTDYDCSFCIDNLSTNESMRKLSVRCTEDAALRNLTTRLAGNNVLSSLQLTRTSGTFESKRLIFELLKCNSGIEIIFAEIIPTQITEKEDDFILGLERNTTLQTINHAGHSLCVSDDCCPKLAAWKRTVYSTLKSNKAWRKCQSAVSQPQKPIPLSVYPTVMEKLANRPTLLYQLLQQQELSSHIATS